MNKFDLEAFKRGDVALTRQGDEALYIGMNPNPADELNQMAASIFGSVYGFSIDGIYYKNGQSILDLVSIKPKTININGFEVPEPMRVAPSMNQEYWCVDFELTDYVNHFYWNSNAIAVYRLKAGLCHSTKEAAQLHARALLSFTEVK